MSAWLSPAHGANASRGAGGSGPRQTTKTFVGTPCWMAPEVMEQADGYDYKADVWSLGITALELAKGFARYAHHAPMKVLLLTIQEEPPSLRSYADEKQTNGEAFSRGFKEILRMCLQKDPKKRPTAVTLLNHKYFKQERDAASLCDELLSKIADVGLAAAISGPLALGVPVGARLGRRIEPERLKLLIAALLLGIGASAFAKTVVAARGSPS